MVIRYPNGQSSAYDGGKNKIARKIARPKLSRTAECVLKKQLIKAMPII